LTVIFAPAAGGVTLGLVGVVMGLSSGITGVAASPGAQC
jgi:hypothetical protein